MTFDLSAVSIIEAALDQNPHCRACGAAMTVRTEADRVVVECRRVREPAGPLRRLLRAVFPHDQQVVIG